MAAPLDPAHVHYIKLGDPQVPECTGAFAAPSAKPGNFCIYEGLATNASHRNMFGVGEGDATVTGGRIFAFSTAAGQFEVVGSWAVTGA